MKQFWYHNQSEHVSPGGEPCSWMPRSRSVSTGKTWSEGNFPGSWPEPSVIFNIFKSAIFQKAWTTLSAYKVRKLVFIKSIDLCQILGIVSMDGLAGTIFNFSRVSFPISFEKITLSQLLIPKNSKSKLALKAPTLCVRKSDSKWPQEDHIFRYGNDLSSLVAVIPRVRTLGKSWFKAVQSSMLTERSFSCVTGLTDARQRKL